ncbi:hypothetical protein T484DRAFT_1746804 [Baffinella frigidus]|nr:hypothetical protein T484DRAFT_1746804 [Cryptophyta sp. CCMP2293]
MSMPAATEDLPIARVRSWSAVGRSLKTIFGGPKRCVSSSEKSLGAESSSGELVFFETTVSATSSSDSDAFTIEHGSVADSEVDLTHEDLTHEDLRHAEDEVESALRDCEAPPSEMLLAFASVQSWGRSDNEYGTEHYGAGYNTVQVGLR